MNTREQQFDEQWRLKLHDFGEEPDEGLMEQIEAKHHRVVDVYRLAPYLFMLALVGLIGVSCYLIAGSMSSQEPKTTPAGAPVFGSTGETRQVNLPEANRTNSDNTRAADFTIAAASTSGSNVVTVSGTNPVNPSINQGILAAAQTALMPHTGNTTTEGNRPPNKQETDKKEDNSKPVSCQASFDYYTSYNGELQFSNTSIAPDNLRLEWLFGDGNSETLPAAAHRYQTNGNYVVTLNYYAGDRKACSYTKEVNYRFYQEQKQQQELKGIVFEDSYVSDKATVMLYGFNAATNRYEYISNTQTGPLGNFVFTNIPEGRYHLAATKAGEDFVLTFYGDEAGMENATPVFVTNASAGNGDYIINLQRKVRHLDLSSNNNKPDTDNYVLVLDHKRNVLGSVKTNSNGTPQMEQLKLPPGTYTLKDPVSGDESTMDIGFNNKGSNGETGSGNSKGVSRNTDPVKLIPNPAVNNIHFEVTLENEQQILIRILNASGIEVYSETRMGNMGVNTMNILISVFPAGVYYVVVKKATADATISQLIKQ